MLEETGVTEGVSRLVFPNNREVPNDRIIEIVAEDAVEATHS